ncbi:hypothetical protein PUN28_009273 [Cardiocondyla obscurior]|uniref:Uncharacterized protein n=1 Tax=Cardiocondyla obscurior TaxID=286306 RepID=A0AAW2FR93_9HYME
MKIKRFAKSAKIAGKRAINKGRSLTTRNVRSKNKKKNCRNNAIMCDRRRCEKYSFYSLETITEQAYEPTAFFVLASKNEMNARRSNREEKRMSPSCLWVVKPLSELSLRRSTGRF